MHTCVVYLLNTFLCNRASISAFTCFFIVMMGLFFCFFCLQITELLDDERCEAECEELPQDGEEGPASLDSPQHTQTDVSPSARWDSQIMVRFLGLTCDNCTWVALKPEYSSNVVRTLFYRSCQCFTFFELLQERHEYQNYSTDGSSTLQDKPLHIQTHAPTQHIVPSRQIISKLN